MKTYKHFFYDFAIDRQCFQVVRFEFANGNPLIFIFPTGFFTFIFNILRRNPNLEVRLPFRQVILAEFSSVIVKRMDTDDPLRDSYGKFGHINSQSMYYSPSLTRTVLADPVATVPSNVCQPGKW